MKRKISRIFGVGLTVALLASLMVAAAPVGATVSEPAVTVSPTDISTAAEYLIKFDAYFALANTDDIFVKFPSNTTVPATITAPNITVSYDQGTYTPVTVAPSSSATTRIVEFKNPTATTSASHIWVKFLVGAGIKNPSTPGSYILEVKTDQETTYVESASYTIGIPGLVTRYNKDGNYVGSYNKIQDALTASASEDVLKIGPGTYPDAIANIVSTKIKIEATGDADETIVKATVAIDQANTTFDGLTLKGAVTVTADDVTIKNCILTKKDKTGEQLLSLDSTSDRLEVENCTFDTTYKSVQDTCVEINDGDSVVIKDCVFTTDEGTTTAQDKAIEVLATSAVTALTVKNCTFNGTKGIAYLDANTSQTTATIKDNTFDGYEEAFDVNNVQASSKLTIRNNTINNCTKKTLGAIDINATTATVIVGNTIEDNAGYSVHIAANQDVVTVIGNNFVNNVYGFKNATTTKMSALNNWWGDATGPAGEGTGSGDKVSTYVTYKPYLAAPLSLGQSTSAATSLDAKTVAGVKVSGLATNATLIWAAKYAANPQDVEPKYDALADTWFDVYIKDGSAPTAGITIKLYADGIDKNTDAYVWSGLESKWVKCSDQGASSTGGYVWLTVKTSATTPLYGDLSELPFVLVAAPEAAASTFTLTAPEAGATDMPVTNVPFTWASVTDATSYDLVLSASADLSAPVAEATGIAGTAYTYSGVLSSSTPYYWQVTAMREDTTVEGRSDVATFITVAKEVFTCPQCGLTFDTREELAAHIAEAHPPVEPPKVTVEAPPAAEITVEAPPAAAAPQVTVNIPPAAPAEAAPTPAYIWVITAIGAILVIAVIILIVRTRRVA